MNYPRSFSANFHAKVVDPWRGKRPRNETRLTSDRFKFHVGTPRTRIRLLRGNGSLHPRGNRRSTLSKTTLETSSLLRVINPPLPPRDATKRRRLCRLYGGGARSGSYDLEEREGKGGQEISVAHYFAISGFCAIVELRDRSVLSRRGEAASSGLFESVCNSVRAND